MKATIYSERLRAVHMGVHPLLRRLITGMSISFDAESLEAALHVDQPDFVIVGTFSVPGFLEVERRYRDGVQIPCFVMGMTPAPLFEDDAVRLGFGGAVSIGGTVAEDEVAAEIQRCLTSGSSKSEVRRSADVDLARRTFGVLYLDQIDFDIGYLVSVGMTDREIAATVHLAPQTVRNRVSAILYRSRLVNRTDLAIHHPLSSVKVWELGPATH